MSCVPGESVCVHHCVCMCWPSYKLSGHTCIRQFFSQSDFSIRPKGLVSGVATRVRVN